MKSTILLLEDHKQILKALRVLEGMSVLAERGHHVNENDVADLLEFFEGFGDRIHQSREEGIFFPALLRDREQTHYHELCGMVFEHNRQRSLLEGLHDSLPAKSSQDFRYYADRLVDAMRRHLKEEEERLFPLAAATLSVTDDDHVYTDMTAEDKEWQEKNLPRLLERLEALASTYDEKS